MNILQMEDMVKGLPDQILMQEAQMPSGQIPQFLALSEVQRRQEMRQKLQAPPEATVADQILQGGIASAMPQQGPQQPPAPPQGMPQGMPPQGQPPAMMYGGGMVPSGIVRMQNLGQVPNESPALRRVRIQNEIINARLAGADPRVIKELEDQLRILTPAGTLSAGAAAQQGAMNQPMFEAMNIAPTMETPTVSMDQPEFDLSLPPAAQTAPVPAAAPAGVASDATAMGTPAPTDIASMMAATTGAMGPAYQSLLGMMPNVPRDNTALMELMPTQEQFDALKTDFSPFIQQVQQRGEERVKRYEESIKDIEERMKRERLGAVLTTLGSSLFAGEGAMGLEKAGAIAQQIGKEMRQEIGTERRAMEAARDTAADKALALQIQQVTSDKDAQREFLKSKNDFQKLVFQVEQDRGKEERQARRDAINLASSLATNTLSRLRTLEEQNQLNLRSFITAMGNEGKIINELLETSVGLTPEEKINQYNTMMESRIRGFGALFPNIDVEAVISALSQKPATTAGATQQGEREPLSKYLAGG